MQRYDRTSAMFHWLIGIAILGQFALGWWMLDVPKDPPGLRAGWFNLHKSIGITLAAFVVLRLVWRATHPAPVLPGVVPRLQRLAATTTHGALYACMLVLPLSGYLGSSFTKYPIRYFGQALPHWGWDWPAAKSVASTIHFSAACLLGFLIALHIAGAFWHLARRDGLFARMWPAMLMLFIALPALAGPLAYVANEKSGTISVIDTATDAVVGEIAAGKKPRGMALSSDGARLYVSDQAANALLVVDTAARRVERTIALGESPEGVSLSPDGSLVAAASEIANAVILVEAATGKVLATVRTEGKNPEHAVFSTDGRWVYVSAEDASQVDVIDVRQRRQAGSIAVARRPRGIAFTPDGRHAWVACELDSKVFMIDVAMQRVVASLPGGNFSNGVTLSPDGKRVYVSNGRDASVLVIDAKSARPIATVAVGQRPWNMGITADGTKLYVANGRSNSVSVIDTARGVKITDIAVGELPWGVVVHQEARR